MSSVVGGILEKTAWGGLGRCLFWDKKVCMRRSDRGGLDFQAVLCFGCCLCVVRM